MSLAAVDIKKIGVNLLFLVLLLWVYFANFRAELLKKRERVQKEVAELREQVRVAKEQIARTRALGEKAGSAEEVFAYFSQFMREGEPIAWFPPQIEAFFDRHGAAGVVTRLGTTGPVGEPELSQFSALNWTVDVPRVGFAQLGIAVAALENEIPTLEIRSLRVEVPENSPEFQRVLLGVATVLKPRE